MIDHRFKEMIDGYVLHGRYPDDFITAVLENNLTESFGNADLGARDNLYDIVKYCYNSLPITCWGSRQAVMRWYEMVLNGEAADAQMAFVARAQKQEANDVTKGLIE